MGTNDERADLVFEGSGAAFIAFDGAFVDLDEFGVQPQCMSGTAARSITASMAAAAGSGAE
jgi:predicted acylesterase/phospholipase RssA